MIIPTLFGNIIVWGGGGGVKKKEVKCLNATKKGLVEYRL